MKWTFDIIINLSSSTLLYIFTAIDLYIYIAFFVKSQYDILLFYVR